MKRSRWLRMLLMTTLLVVSAVNGHAQTERSRPEDESTSHKKIPFECKGIPDLLLRWNQIRQQRVTEVLEKLNQSPVTLTEDDKQLLVELLKSIRWSELKPDDPLKREAEELRAKLTSGSRAGKPALENLESIQKFLERIQQRAQAGARTDQSLLKLPNPEPSRTASSSDPAGTSQDPNPPVPNAAGTGLDAEEMADRFRFLNWLMDQSERLNNMSGPLADSPALQQARRDLKRATEGTDLQALRRFGGQSGLDKQLSRWGRQAGQSELWSKFNVPALPKLTLPPLSRPNLPNLSLPGTGMPSLGLPNLGAPSAPHPGSETHLLWLAVALVAGVVIWRLYRAHVPAAVRPRRPHGGLFAWTGAPETIATREDLVKAFECLSLQMLGEEVRTWNHLEIAAALGGEGSTVGDGRRRAASRLADLYEQARYAPGDGPLSEDALQSARSALSLLAGMATL